MKHLTCASGSQICMPIIRVQVLIFCHNITHWRILTQLCCPPSHVSLLSCRYCIWKDNAFIWQLQLHGLVQVDIIFRRVLKYVNWTHWRGKAIGLTWCEHSKPIYLYEELTNCSWAMLLESLYFKSFVCWPQ